ncbi:unnamed protein product [Cylindrotheca closterium]|uniref:Helicase-associated domain-containing protein n=1 Tax=Cylindrotheca closterium TaxID=2856 RepID=A0AAD2CBX4_9STRA|nr:unnamed protein product [Cylindrotheca closterium]
MDFEIEELITDYLEWQVANHGKGESVLAAWKKTFAPKVHTTTKKYVAIRKSEQMKSLALFLDRGDALACVPTIGDSEKDDICVNKEFSSFCEALMYMAGNSSKSNSNSNGAIQEELKEDNNPVKTDAPHENSNETTTTTPVAQIDTDNENGPDDDKKRDRPPEPDGDASEPSAKKIKSEDIVKESASPETPQSSVEPNPNARQKVRLWRQRFSELAALWDGETVVYQSDIGNNKSLANWVKHQRKLFKKGDISAERMSRLESIGFKWIGKNSVVLSNQPQSEGGFGVGKVASINLAKKRQQWNDPNDAWAVLWEKRYQELVEYKKRFGDTKVPKEWAENKQLAGWVRKQREQYRREAAGEQTALTDERKEKLFEIGFVWSLRPGRLKNPLPPPPEPSGGQNCIMGKEDESRDVEPYSVDKNGYLII